MPKPCPDSVVSAGARLLTIRRAAKALADAVDEGLPNIRAAIDEVVKVHGARAAQAGHSIAVLRQSQASEGLTMEAHDSLRLVLKELDIAEPTDEQLSAILGTLSIR